MDKQLSPNLILVIHTLISSIHRMAEVMNAEKFLLHPSSFPAIKKQNIFTT